jgi:magnesium chelatase family protein
MLAARLPGLLPPLDPAEALEVSMVHPVAGSLRDGRLMISRPFRGPPQGPHRHGSLAFLAPRLRK